VQGNGMASAKQLALPLESPGDEPVAGNRESSHSVQPSPWMARVLSRDNLNRALKQVRRNKGAPGIDGMTVDELPDYLRQHWPEIRQQLLQQSYRPKPVRRVTIPKANGGSRPLGIPTVLDRFIQQAIAQVIQQDCELDWELERRNLCFARYADDCQIYVGSRRAGERVMVSLTRFIEDSLRLTVNTRKSAVDRPWKRSFLGFTLSTA